MKARVCLKYLGQKPGAVAVDEREFQQEFVETRLENYGFGPFAAFLYFQQSQVVPFGRFLTKTDIDLQQQSAIRRRHSVAL